MQPGFAKIDVETLRRELPKVDDNFPTEAAKRWRDWVEDSDSLANVPAEYDWPLDALVTATRCYPSAVDQEPSAELLALREKETQPTREVIVLYIAY